MEENLWYLKQQSRILQEFREEIRPFWNDAAAREINAKFLNAHADDDSNMLDAFKKLEALYADILLHLEAATQVELNIANLSQKIHDRLELCEQEVVMAHQIYDQHLEYISLTQHLIDETERLVDQANSACEGVATE